MIDFIKGFKRPFSDLKKFVIGLFIILIPLLNITLGFGYILKCAETRFKKKGKSGYVLPKWDNWSKLFLRGLLGLVITALYMFLFVFIFVITFSMIPGKMMLTLVSLLETKANITFLTLLTTIDILPAMIFIILFLIAAWIIPLALLNYVKKWEFLDAFKIKEIHRKISINYVMVWILSIIYVGGLVYILNYIVGYLGYVIGIYITFITVSTWLAEAYMGK